MTLGAGTVTWAFAGISLQKALEEIGSLGIRHIDILGMLHGDPENLTTDIKKSARDYIRGEGLSVSSILAVKPGMNIASKNRDVQRQCREYFKRIIDLCEFFESSEICFMAGYREFETELSASWDQAVEFSQWIAESCQKTGILATYELEWRTYGLVRSVCEMNRMIEQAASSNLYANIDLGHAGLIRDNYLEMEKIGSKTIHLHFNDNDTVLHTNALPGDGEVPIIEYVKALNRGGMQENAAKMNHSITAGIEVEDASGSGDQPVELIRRSKEWILKNISDVYL